MDTGGLMIIFGMIGDLDHAFCSPYISCTRSQRVAALVSQIQIAVRRASLSTLHCYEQYTSLDIYAEHHQASIMESASFTDWALLIEPKEPSKTDKAQMGQQQITQWLYLVTSLEIWRSWTKGLSQWWRKAKILLPVDVRKLIYSKHVERKAKATT